MNRVLVIGSTTTTLRVLYGLIRNGFEITGILGYMPKSNTNVSGWEDLRPFAFEYKIPFFEFTKINNEECFEWANSQKPDIIFAVGFSQLLHDKWLKLTPFGCVGFHPTVLPAGRGRAPLAWIILREFKGAATFFHMGKGADDGPIFVQDYFFISDIDDASSVMQKILISIDNALDTWLPKLKMGIWDPMPQNEVNATSYGIRKPSDSYIDWNNRAQNIDKLIKASTKPHPGAYFYIEDKLIRVWKSRVDDGTKIHGVIGRVLLINDHNEYLVQCGEGKLWITDLELGDFIIRIGDLLTYNVYDEIFQLRNELKSLKNG